MRRLLRDSGAGLPVALLALAFFLMLLFQMVELVRQSRSILQTGAGQQNALQEATKLRQAIDGLVSDLDQLARQGNANAQQVIDELARQNINLRPQQPGPPAREQ